MTNLERLEEILRGKTEEEINQLVNYVAETMVKEPERYGLKKIVTTDLPEGIKEKGFKDGMVLRAAETK